MASEKVDVVIVGAGASGSTFAAVLAKAGKKVVILEQGPDWQLSDLVSSDIWGRRMKPAGPPFRLEGKHPVSYGYQGGWGVGGTVTVDNPDGGSSTALMQASDGSGLRCILRGGGYGFGGGNCSDDKGRIYDVQLRAQQPTKAPS